MGTPALGKIGIRLESLTNPPGELLIVPASSGTPLSATTQPMSAGMRLRVQVWANSTSGTVSILGTVGGSPVTEVSPTIPIAPFATQGQLVNIYEYTTTNVFTAISASGITTTGLTNAVIRIVGIAASSVAL